MHREDKAIFQVEQVAKQESMENTECLPAEIEGKCFWAQRSDESFGSAAGPINSNAARELSRASK